MNQEIMKELQEVEEMVKEAQEHEEYTEKYFILREGMIKLAGGFVQAALLSSLLGWTRHWLKTDNEIYKQIQAAAEIGDIEKIRKLKQEIRQGWFWKSYREMSEELLGEVSIKTCQRYVEKFEKRGLISSRDPEEKSTYRARWYKANIDTIKEELEKMGYQLDYFKDQRAICQNDKSQNTGVSAPETPESLDSGICQNDKSCGQNDKSSGQNDKHLLYSSSIDSLLDLSPEEEEEENPTVDPVKIFKKAWQEVFPDCVIQDNQVNEFIGLAITKGLTMDEIKKEMEHIQSFYQDDKEADYAALLYRSMEAGGWVKTGKAFTRAKRSKAKKSTRKSSSRKSKKDQLPKAVQKQMEEEKNGSTPTSDHDPELAEKQARIKAKLKLMYERLEQRKQRADSP